MVKSVPIILHEHTQASKNLETSPSGRDPKPKKPPKEPNSYRPISLLCFPFQILEKLIYTRIEPIVDPLLPREQAGFRHGRSTVGKVTLLTQKIEDSFSANRKAGAVFVDLTAVYDTVWHRGLTSKLMRLLPDRHMVSLMMELVRNRSFTLAPVNGLQSRLRRLKNGVPQGSVLVSLLFNIYTHDPPVATAKNLLMQTIWLFCTWQKTGRCLKRL